jgi:hypothetical protein
VEVVDSGRGAHLRIRLPFPRTEAVAA